MALLDLDQILHASPVLDSEGLQHLLDSYRLLNRQSEEFGKGLQILADASRKGKIVVSIPQLRRYYLFARIVRLMIVRVASRIMARPASNHGRSGTCASRA